MVLADYKPQFFGASAIRTARLGHGGPGSLEHRLAARQYTAPGCSVDCLTGSAGGAHARCGAARRDAIAIGAAYRSCYRELEDARALVLPAETGFKIMPDGPSR